jgi:hypothetical protein
MDLIPPIPGVSNAFNSLGSGITSATTGSAMPSLSSVPGVGMAGLLARGTDGAASLATGAAARADALANAVSAAASDPVAAAKRAAAATADTALTTTTKLASLGHYILTTIPIVPTISGLPPLPSINLLPSAPTALTMPTISFSPIIPTTNHADIEAANPLRIQSMRNIIEKQAVYNAQMPTLESAKIPAEVLTPMKKYLDDEVNWWKANILLTTKQVKDRTALYTQTINTLTANLEKNTINALGAMSPEDYAVAINKLTQVRPSLPTDPKSKSAARREKRLSAKSRAESENRERRRAARSQQSPTETTSGFADMPTAPATAITVIDIGKVKEESKKLNENTAAENALYGAENINYWDYTKAAFKSIFSFKIILSITFFTFTFILASYVANDNLHRRPAFRVLKFIGTILFTVFSPFGYLFMWGLIVYYIYRGISYKFFNNINNRIIALSILPLIEKTAEDYNNANLFTKYLYVYTLEGSHNEQINSVVKDRGALYDASRFAYTKDTHGLQEQLKSMR